MSIAVKIKGAEETVSSKAYVKALAASTKRARLHTLRFFNKGAAACYIQVHDTAATPGDMANLLVVIKAPADAWVGDELGDGLHFANGIHVFASSSPSALTAIAGDDLLITVAITKTR
jgi:hypothetical protein